ncbi:dipeptidase [Roseomonas sp. NAR14]|uniref:Dipeptidase n=1 Tax=Roseomonas acroporae TaxID=2937791 RepID=A0A9X1YGE1_9PROT|nr:dipeptidase [Roseomonas acroporae]MCK8785791.1 dipeptidase [Roseomonas acroporae]
MSDPTTAPTTSVLARLDADATAARDRLFDWLRIPSVSAQPAHAGDCVRAAEWVRDQLAAIGFAAELRPTPGHPVVIAHHPGTGPAGAPRLLYYGHYDVQPAEPLDLWVSPPFAPVEVQGPHGPRVVARGAVDDKGQTLMWIEALRAWHAVAGGPPVPVTVVIEGEEETGSTNLDAFLAANRDALRADVAVISDTGMWDIETPAITTRLRGLVYAQIDLFAASRDLHSGLYGGSALNPINLLARILGDLHDAEGRVRLPGFYDGVRELTAEQRAAWDSLGFDEAAFLGEVGLSVPAGERGRSGPERLWARPTADVNGIWGGYTGEGSKTVIAAEAHAKVSFRLVPGQDPAKVEDAFRQFVNERLPADARVEFRMRGGSPGIEIPDDSPWVRAARAVLAEEYGRPAVLIGAGGSIPVVESLRRLLGLDSLLLGFGLADDGMHSPNEKFELRCFHGGARSHARLLGRLAGP